jgi:uncharacterized membrane protein
MLIINKIKSKYLIHFRIFFPIFYFVGILGILIEFSSSSMISLTPFALLLSSLALVIFHNSGFGLKELLVFSLILFFGFFVEVVGVNTGLIFGQYSYGKTLGIKWLDTPLMIAVNWLLLVYSTAAMLSTLKINIFVKLLISTAIMVVYDFLLEPVAPKLDMWSWSSFDAPLQNYFAWAIVAFAFHFLIYFAKLKIVNPMASTIFICQFVFFLILNLYL